MTTAIIGVGNIGSTVARHLVAGREAVVLAAQDKTHAEALANELGPLARAGSVNDAIGGSDTVVLALWLDQIKELVPEQAAALENKVVVDPSNPLGFDESGQMLRTLPDNQSAGSIVASLLPANTHYVKAFRHAQRRVARRSGKPRAAGRPVLRDRRRRRRDDDRTADPGRWLRPDEGGRRCRRLTDRDARRRPPPVRLERRAPRSRRSTGCGREKGDSMSATDTSTLPDYAPVPRSALGPALNEQGYYVGRVERNLYWITDGTYQSAFLTTSDLSLIHI